MNFIIPKNIDKELKKRGYNEFYFKDTEFFLMKFYSKLMI